MSSERCLHGLLAGMCALCLRRENEIKKALEKNKAEEQSAYPTSQKRKS